MGQIVGIRGNVSEQDDRRDGMKTLGQSIISNVKGKADSQKLYAALTGAMAKGVRLYFQNSDTGKGKGLRIHSLKVPGSSDTIECELRTEQDDLAGTLSLVVKVDDARYKSGKDPKDDRYKMNIIFPEELDNSMGPNYLQEVAGDVVNQPTLSKLDATKYLAASHFLSRCK